MNQCANKCNLLVENAKTWSRPRILCFQKEVTYYTSYLFEETGTSVPQTTDTRWLNF
jgi:hypothetical protein